MILSPMQESCTGPEELFIEPVYAVRGFLLDGPYIHSAFVRGEWHQGKLSATCHHLGRTRRADPTHRPPVERCECGIYAWNALRPITESIFLSSLCAVGVVSLSGRILVGEKGYRAERAEVLALGGNVAWDQKRFLREHAHMGSLPVPVFETVEQMLAEFPLSKIEVPA